MIRALHELDVEAVAIYSTADARRAARAHGRPRGPRRPAGGRRELPPHPERDRCRRDDGLPGGPSRLRLPRREPGVRRGVRRERPRLRRAARGRDGDDGRQDLREAGDARARTCRRCRAPKARRPSRRRGRPPTRWAIRSCSRRARAAAARACGSFRRPRTIEDAFGAAAAEAQAAFGDPRLYVEKALAPARHVEIQVLCDHYGNVLTLGERECSIQRRHQKLIEESPSAALTPETREQMEAAAERACRAVGYRNAGTFEFLLGPDGSFYFIELNARLQVEHPVTELVHGHRHRARAAARRRRRGGLGHRPRAAARARDRDPPERRGPRARLPSVARADRRASRTPEGPGVRARHVHRVRLEDPAVLRLDGREADRLGLRSRRRDRARASVRCTRRSIEGVPTTRDLALEVLASEPFRTGDYSTSTLEALRAVTT